jgi:hypothetical protein
MKPGISKRIDELSGRGIFHGVRIYVKPINCNEALLPAIFLILAFPVGT